MKKQNKRTQITRIALALLLILSMIGNTLSLPAVAQESLTPTDETILPETPLDGTSDATGAATLPEPIQLTAADIPEFISAAALEERGAVERMRSEETNMSSVIFRNADGTRTMYMYGLPVKYTAMDGTVRDKSTNLVSVSAVSALLANRPVAQTMAQMSTAQQAALQAELGILDAERATTTLHMLSTALTTRGKSLSDMAYTTLDNDVYALFPTNLAQGMTLVFGEHSVRMTPAGTGMTVTAGGNVTKTTTSSLSDADVAERLLYPNVFGLGTAVQYTPTLTGVKEEILLSRNVGKNSFAFLLETGGLILTETNGQFTLVDPETEQKVGTLGEIIVFDSAGQITRGNMTAQTILAGQKYSITISVDQEFLVSATYPVSIDPTVDTIHPIEEPIIDQPKVMIEDVSIYEDPEAEGYTFIEWHQIGKVIATDYRGQAAFRFPVLYDPSVGTEHYLLTSEEISSFVLHLKSTGNTTTTNVLWVDQYAPAWPNDNTAKIFDPLYFDYYACSDNAFAISNVPSNSTFSIDLTVFAKIWKDIQHGTHDNCYACAETGVLLYNFNNQGNIWLESVEYSTDIYVTMEYASPTEGGDFYMNNRATKKFLTAFDDEQPLLLLYSGLVGEMDPYITWNVEYIGNGNFYLHPNGRDDLYLDMYGNFRTAETFQAKWTRSIPDGGGVVWTAYNGNVLAVNSNGNVVIGAPSQFSAEQMAWRMVQTNSYVEMPEISDFGVTILPTEQASLYWPWGDIDFTWDTYDNFQVTRVSGVNATYNGVGRFSPGASTGLTTFRVEHVPTGQDFYYYLYSTNIPKLDIRKIYTFSDTTKCLHALGTSYSALKAISKVGYDDASVGRQMWGFEYLGGGKFVITSLGILDGSNTDRLSLKTTSTGKVRLIRYSGAETQQWGICYVTNSKCYLYNFNNPEMRLQIDSSGSSVTATGTALTISPLNDIPVCLFGGTFNNISSDGRLYIKVEVDASVSHLEALINDSVVMWNGLSSNVHIYRTDDVIPNNITTITVRYTAAGDEDKNEYGKFDFTGQTTGIVNGRLVNDLSQNLDAVLIKLDTLYFFATATRPEQIHTIAHEMGHALKLTHPRHSGYSSDDDKSGNHSVLAIMNQTDGDVSCVTYGGPSVHDIYFLRMKWGD